MVFLQLGRYIERADQTTRLLDTKYRLLTDDAASAEEIGQWHALLRSASGYHAFRRVHKSDMTAARVVGFLLYNPSFPRSVYLCVCEIDRALTGLKSQYRVRRGNDVAEGVDALRAILESRMTEENPRRGPARVHRFLATCIQRADEPLVGGVFWEFSVPDEALGSSARAPIVTSLQIPS